MDLPAGYEGTDIPRLMGFLREAGAGLAYFFVREKKDDLDKQLTENGAILYDEKITYSKELTGKPSEAPQEVGIYEGPVTDKLLELALLAGHDSRFRKDPRLSSYFEPMYKLWMINSLNGVMADRVFVYRSGDGIEGMASCKIRNGKTGEGKTGSIGLIATAAGQQGKGIGRALLRATDHYYGINKVTVSTIVTQRSNEQACRFYEKAGFTEYKTEYVYHLWFNRSL